jgi:hypothetical protein
VDVVLMQLVLGFLGLSGQIERWGKEAASAEGALEVSGVDGGGGGMA